MTDNTENKKYASDYEEIGTRDDYLKKFVDPKEAFKHVLDIRKFEIELYWKRATYFWTFIGAILAGYFLVIAKSVESTIPTTFNKILYLLNCLGLIFSFAWYFVNRGSKFWQINWEKHMDVMEDEVIGSLYKTTISKEHYRKKLFNPIAPFPFSVSKINQILNIFLIFFWSILLVDFSYKNLDFKLFEIDGYWNFYFAIGAITIVGIFCMFNFAQTGLTSYLFNNNGARKHTYVDFEKRGVENKE